MSENIAVAVGDKLSSGSNSSVKKKRNLTPTQIQSNRIIIISTTTRTWKDF